MEYESGINTIKRETDRLLFGIKFLKKKRKGNNHGKENSPKVERI